MARREEEVTPERPGPDRPAVSEADSGPPPAPDEDAPSPPRAESAPDPDSGPTPPPTDQRPAESAASDSSDAATAISTPPPPPTTPAARPPAPPATAPTVPSSTASNSAQPSDRTDGPVAPTAPAAAVGTGLPATAPAASGHHHHHPSIEARLRELFHITKLRRLKPFFVWLAIFYVLWIGIVAWQNAWLTMLAHWPIAVAMALGSYVAGSTPMGGGTIGFPVLVLFFDFEATIGRDFSFAIQSIGMTSAAIFIFATRARRLAWKVLGGAAAGTLIGTPLGCLYLAPALAGYDLVLKLTFAVIWASFGLLHFYRIRQITATHGAVRISTPLQLAVGFAFGLLGGLISSIVGVGIDMLVYILLVILFRADLKIAIPTSVILMALTSLIGVAVNGMRVGLGPEVIANWYAAAPIVALGAPFGALVVHFMPRTPTLLFVSFLCVLQYVWTCLDQKVTGWPLVASLAGIVAFNIFFQLLYALGTRLDRRTERIRADRQEAHREAAARAAGHADAS